jgi:hypothetical protein
VEGHYSAPLGGLTRATLEFYGGRHTTTVTVDPGLAELFRARFESDRIQVAARGETVSVGSRLQITGPRPAGDVVLNGTIPWGLSLRGGNNAIEADLSQVQLFGLDISGGSNDIELRTGPAAGVVPVRINGGANKLVLLLPADTGARVAVRGGISELDLDGDQSRTITGRRWQSAGFDESRGYLDITIRGGANTLRAGFRP